MFFLMLVLHDPEDLENILTAWDSVGVSGITILPSTGLARFRQRSGLREDMPLIPTLADFQEHVETLNCTLFTIIQDEATVDLVVEVTQSVLGNLNLPNTGILCVLPVLRAYGLDRMAGAGYESTRR